MPAKRRAKETMTETYEWIQQATARGQLALFAVLHPKKIQKTKSSGSKATAGNVKGKLCFTCFTKYKKVEVTTGYSVYCFTCRCSSGSSRQRGGPKSRGEGRCQRPRGCWSRQSGATPAAPHTNTHSSQGSCASSGSFVVVKAFKGLLQLVSGWGLGFRIRVFRSRYRSQVTVVVGA